MITFSSIGAVALRHMRTYKRDINFLFGVFYWPLLDIIIWGFLGRWIQQTNAAQFHNYEVAALLGILLWQVVGRGCNVMILTLAEELWSNNVVNLFSLPLRLSEWMCGSVLFYIIMMCMTTVFCMAVMFIFYTLPIWHVISTFMIFMPPLLFSAFWLGFTSLQIVTLMGRRGTESAFIFGWFLLPFSGAYYPTEVLPQWARGLSSCLPMSYVFQGMRNYVMHQQDPTVDLLKGSVLGIVYTIFAVILFVYFFNHSKQKGLARLAD